MHKCNVIRNFSDHWVFAIYLIGMVSWLLRPIYLRQSSFETFLFRTLFSRDHINLTSHSFYTTLKWSCFDLLCIRFFTIYLPLLCGRPEVLQRDSTFEILQCYNTNCKCTRTLKHRWDQKTLHTSGLEGSPAPQKYHLDHVKEFYVLLSCSTRKDVTLQNLKWRFTLKNFRLPAKKWKADHKNVIHSKSKQLNFNVA